MTSRRLLAVTLAAALLAACGDGSRTETTAADVPLTAAEHGAAERSVRAIRDYCRAVASYVAGRARAPARVAAGRAMAAADLIAALAQRKPRASYRGSQTARDLAADLAEDLEGTNCSRALVAALARGLR